MKHEDTHAARKAHIEDAMIIAAEDRASQKIVHLVVKGYGLTVCCKQSPIELPRNERMTTDRKRCTCHNKK